VSCTLVHTRPHQAISTEFHTRTGPFTLVPLSDQRSSLVWVVEPETAEELRALDDAAFAFAVERQAHSILGKMKLAGARAIFPLQAQSARRLAASRIVLVGEAAHVLPPIGAQGFNLGLRDAVAIADLAAQSQLSGDDLGSDRLTARYNEIRRGDVTTRTLAVDLLNRSLLTDFLPVQGLRGLGLSLLKRIGPLRRAVMRQGVAGAGQRPAH
jgi:2-octaprenyl-6-methoxyphenol hydroxylase